jgi:hypothetical protein
MNCESCGSLLPEHEIVLRKCRSCRMRDSSPLSSMTDARLGSLLRDARIKFNQGKDSSDETLRLAGWLEVDVTKREISQRIIDRRRLGLDEGFEGIFDD